MSNLIRNLLYCVEERRAEILMAKREYRQATGNIEEHWEAFKSSLSDQQLRQLDGLLAEEFDIQCLEEEASFQAALALGIELSRL